MSPAEFDRVKIKFSNNNSIFEMTSKTLIFDGYQKNLSKNETETTNQPKTINLNNYNIGSKHQANNSEIVSRKSSPPSKFTQASLVKQLEDLGIGRPSTYATMSNICLERGYATLIGKFFEVSEIGYKVNEILEKNFSTEINEIFSVDMENRLDKIAKGEEG